MIKLQKTNEEISYQAIDSFLPRLVTVPIDMEGSGNYKLLVSEGDRVREGQVIARSQDPLEPLAAQIHSPIPGIVTGFSSVPLFDGKKSDAVLIMLEGKFSYRGKKSRPNKWSDISPSEIVEMISYYGVINTFFINKPFSLATQIKTKKKEASNVLVVRLFDEDPYRRTDSFLTNTGFDRIKKGAAILAYAMNASGIVFAYNDALPSPENTAEETENYDIFNSIPVKYVGVDCTDYPAGFQRILIETVLKKLQNDEIFSKINIYDLLVDSVTLIHLYEAIELHRPVINQYVYVYGDCLKVSGILRLPLGSTIDFLSAQCGGFLKNPSKIIINGQLTGYLAPERSVPITKNVKSVAFASSYKFPFFTPNECVRCGKCRSVCPSGLSPDLLFNQMLNNIHKMEAALLKASNLCMGCTLCNAVCSSRLPLSQAIETLKESQS
ncbi:4Fe-4S dicluster domain-containing protein [Treponema parvum]|uniref:4Fe-4S dicluster domain-containing protein n=1 Tax=Treponema parvum TaxID=138851 RepID=A0A975ICH6_9SPIR|nr:4Fe-4S dicluster domain-containing protein [Treponema parvum]QTQ11802.1 4Fe-4S dicluster domain-containing protein [Treponema parvum]QTQ16230.1 4Fe-4S dicluster domain-containing protein [Treponema parvum]